jgi:hypothetical protein
LEELDLKDCLITGHEIASASLKTLIMLKCKIECAFSIAAPNLLLLRLVTPYIRVPSFKNLGSLVTGTIILDDSFLGDGFEHISDEDDCDETTDDDGTESDDDDSRENYRFRDDSSLSDDDDFGYVGEDDDFDKFGDMYGFPKQRYGQGGYKNNYDYGSDIDSDVNTYGYSEIANDAKYGCKGKGQISTNDGTYGKKSECNNDRKILGGRHILHSLSSARTLELLTDAREVIVVLSPPFADLSFFEGIFSFV